MITYNKDGSVTVIEPTAGLDYIKNLDSEEVTKDENKSGSPAE